MQPSRRFRSEAGKTSLGLRPRLAGAALAAALAWPSALAGGTYGFGKPFEVVDVAEHLAAVREQLFLEHGVDDRLAHQPAAFQRGGRMVRRNIRRLLAL